MTDGNISETFPLENLDNVVAFLSVFEKPNFSAGECVSKPREFPYMRYSPEFLTFTNTLYKSGLIRSFDWGSWQGEAESYYRDPSRLATADLETLSKLLTLHIRKERFCEGHLDHMLKSGHIVAILRRLKEIRGALV